MSEDGETNERSLSEVELKMVKPILDYLEVNETIAPQGARSLTGKSAATTRRYLVLLCDRDILEPTGNTNAKTYHRKTRK